MTVSIGIHIQEHSLNIVGISPEGKIIETRVIPLEPYNTREQKYIQIVRLLKALEKEYKKEVVRFCFALPQNQVSHFKSWFPFREKFKLIKTLPFEIEDHSPFQPEKVFFDSRVSLCPRENKHAVLCFLTPRETVQEFNEMIKGTKIIPYLLSAEGAVLATLLEGLNPSPEGVGSAVYIYLGWTQSPALLFHEGRLETLSHLSWGFQPIVEAMKKTYRLNTEQAKAQFAEKAFVLMEREGATREQVFFSSLIKKEVNRFVEKFRFLQISMETETELKFQKVFLIGPGSLIKNLPAFLSRTLPLPFARLKTLSGFPEWNPEDRHKQNLLVPLGLAVEGLRRPPYSGLNLLRSLNEKKTLNFQNKWKQTFTAVGLSFAVLTGYALIKNRESRRLAENVHSVFMNYGQKIAFLRPSKIHEEAVEDFLKKKELEQNSKKLLEETLSRPNPLDYMKTLASLLKAEPEWNLKITALKIKGRAIDIKGTVNGAYLKVFKTRLQTLAENNILKEKPLRGKKFPARTPKLGLSAKTGTTVSISSLKSPLSPSLKDKAQTPAEQMGGSSPNNEKKMTEKDRKQKPPENQEQASPNNEKKMTGKGESASADPSARAMKTKISPHRLSGKNEETEKTKTAGEGKKATEETTPPEGITETALSITNDPESSGDSGLTDRPFDFSFKARRGRP